MVKARYSCSRRKRRLISWVSVSLDRDKTLWDRANSFFESPKGPPIVKQTQPLVLVDNLFNHADSS